MGVRRNSPVYHFPWNWALRFSINALQPSWKSMEAAHSRWVGTSVSASHCL